MRITHRFVVEKVSTKRLFLENHFDPQLSFCDVQDITQHSAIDMRSSSRVVIPQVDIFWAGFSCKSRSRANPKAASFVNCLQKHDGEAETSTTYDAVMTHLKNMRPSLVLLENVIGLMQAAPGQLSDADFVLQELNVAGHGGVQRAGYAARRESDSSPLLLRAIRLPARIHRQLFRFDCSETGSVAARLRLYFLAWRVDGDNHTSVNAAFQAYTTVRAHLSFLDTMLSSMVIGSMPADKFITFDIHEAGKDYERVVAEPSEPPAKAAKGQQWQGEHLSFFRDHGLEWPVDLAHSESDASNFVFKRTGLSDRAAELLWFLHKAFPRDPTVEARDVEFVDTNPSMGRLVQGSANPWRSYCPTLVGMSHMCVRYAHADTVIVRLVTPLESFALIGWHASFFKKHVGVDAACLYNMTGNAFSGFGFVPMLAISLLGAGIIAVLPGDVRAGLAVGEETPAAAEGDSDADSLASDSSMLIT